MRFLSLLLPLFIFSLSVSAQTGSLRGSILDKDTGNPIIYANVILEGTNYGASSDENGFYVFSKIPVGTYKLLTTYIGYKNYEGTIEIKDNRIISHSIYMESESIQLASVSISAAKEQRKSEVMVSKLEVLPTEIKALPSMGADADVLQYLQVLPGIVSTGDQGGQIYIRGGSPVQNKIMMDGMTIHNPFHSIGFYSVFETEIIRGVDVLTGGFNAENGGRISAVVDIKTREGNKKRFAGQVSASPFMVRGILEAPLKKFEAGNTAVSVLVSTKKSIIDKVDNIYRYGSVNDSVGLPFYFQDNYAKLSVVSPSGTKFNFFGFNFNDAYRNPSIADIEWTTNGGGTNFVLVPANSDLIMKGNIGFSTYDISMLGTDNRPRQSQIRELVAVFGFTYYGTNSEINYGLSAKGVRTRFEFTNSYNIHLEDEQNTTELAAFFKYRYKWKNLIIEPGIRFQYYASLGKSSIEPRFGMKYNFTDKFRWKLAAGLYSQNLLSSSNERDVLSYFTGFLSGPEVEIKDLTGEFVDKRLQKARHLVSGVEYDLNDNLNVNIEGYVKDMNQLIVVNRNKLKADDSNYAIEEGIAYGVDFSLNYNINKWNLTTNYSWGNVERNDGSQIYPTLYDRRHNVNAILGYQIDDKGDFNVNIRWNFGSGFPFTRTQGFYNNINSEGQVEFDYTQKNPADIGVLYEELRNAGRLPHYHRLDISVNKIFHFSKYMNAEAIVSITNAYNRGNIFYFDRLRYERVNQLPIIPSAGIKFNF